VVIFFVVVTTCVLLRETRNETSPHSSHH
jgi:hypothetical protein